MAQASVTFELGPESVTSVLEIDLATPISGNFAGLIPAGTTARIVGDVNLTGDLVVEGLLTGIDTFTLTGNGFQLLFQNGGSLGLAGVQKSAWVNWGDAPVGWQVGDRLGVAPTAVGKYIPAETTWQGSWATTSRPVNSPAVTLINGQVMQPEVVNLSQSIVLQNLRRVHFHDGAGVAYLRWLKVLNSGTFNTLGDYSIHFHLNGEASRGSLLEDVVVENSQNRAFVPHGSHGITMRGCAAYKTINDGFWWDEPFEYIQTPGVLCPNCDPSVVSGQLCSWCRSFPNTNGKEHHIANNSNDTLWERCLVLDVRTVSGMGRIDKTGFLLGAGRGNRCIDCVGVGAREITGGSAFQWPSAANRNDGGTTWEFSGCVAHNNQLHGLFVWQNNQDDHVISDFIGYHNGANDINHGAYVNHYNYLGGVLHGVANVFNLHAVATFEPILIEDYLTNGRLRISSHNQPGDGTPTLIRRCTFASVLVNEIGSPPPNPSNLIFEDCGLVPADFVFTTVDQRSIFELWEAGVLAHRWNQGVWT